MNIYALFPLIATIAYIPLLVITISTRPWRKQHTLFTLFVIPAMMWSIVDYIFRSNFFPQDATLLGEIVLLMLAWMTIQFHCFLSSFYPPGKGRWLPFAYASLAVMTAVVMLGYASGGVEVVGDKLYPRYNIGIISIAIPLVTLLIRNSYVFLKRLKTLDNPVLYNQIVSLLIGMFVLTVFILTSILPWGREYPITHFGNILVAFILSYATIRHQLIDIRLVLRRVLNWGTLIIAGVGLYLLLFFLVHLWIGFELTSIMLATGMGGATVVVVFF
jgi:hypothetical protein